ncbi:MAG: glucose-1-phosphate adenylyltransferase subunit GlgD [Caldilinea sp. CFX5]|nr:glucose-1-phosphate adenylyltransferase subunit GlgD [Caldilinea sp. CFX5]
MTQAMAIIMGGGASESLSVLTEVRSEPAVPFGGKFRLIDFPLSNCVNSEIYNVSILTQYRPQSLNNHIGIGKPWDLDRASGGVRLLQPYRGGPLGDWQQGTADAVRRNLDFVMRQPEEHVLILAGDHIYLMDYRPMLRQHIQSGADATVAVRRVNVFETHRYGIVALGNDDRILDFQEKPRRARETLASMGIYIFRKTVLADLLQDPAHVDFGRHVLPAMVENKLALYGYTFPGYWADVGTIQAYWEANMSLLAEEPALDLYNPDWVVHTRSEERAPAKIGPNAQVGGNLLSNGCQVHGFVERSVLSPGVYVAEGAVVRNSIILSETVIESGAVVDRAIIDKGVRVSQGAQIGAGDDNTPNKEWPEQINTGLTLVGKGATLPANLTVGRNVVIHPYTDEKAFGRRKNIASGANVGKSMR